MKSLTAVCQTGASMPAINPNGRISRHPPHRGDGENAEMKMYLSKLKDLVPFMPKNRKLSKLEIIQHVIDYICDLQSELETHPEINNFDAAAALNFTANLANADNDDEDDDEDMFESVQERLNGSMQQQQQQQLQQSSPAHQRQPLVDRQTPNTILPATQYQQSANRHQMVTANTTSSSSSTSLSNSNTSSSSFSNNSSVASTTISTPAIATNLQHTVGIC